MDQQAVLLVTLPVVLNVLDVFDDVRVEFAVELVARVGLARLGLEQVLDPVAALRQTLPKAVRQHFALYQLLP